MWENIYSSMTMQKEELLSEKTIWMIKNELDYINNRKNNKNKKKMNSEKNNYSLLYIFCLLNFSYIHDISYIFRRLTNPQKPCLWFYLFALNIIMEFFLISDTMINKIYKPFIAGNWHILNHIVGNIKSLHYFISLVLKFTNKFIYLPQNTRILSSWNLIQ